MPLAALPDHDRLTDPLWQKLFYNYRQIITALRHNGWVTDVETQDGQFGIVADLADGTELAIHCDRSSLPLDPADVHGWIMVRRERPGAETLTALYDSTPDGPQAHHGANLISLLSRIDSLDLAPDRAHTSASVVTPHGVTHHQTGPLESAGTAVARLYEWRRQLALAQGYLEVWARPEDQGYPLAMLESDGYVAVLRVSPWHD